MILRKPTRLTAFQKQIKQALKLVNNPSRLGEESPLASYYFLGQSLGGLSDISTAERRGVLLQKILMLAADLLWGERPPATREEILQAANELQQFPGTPRYSYLVLELRCFRRYIKPVRLSDIWDEYLPGSRAEHYRDYDSAVTQLGQELLKQIQPAFRLEAPTPPQLLTGYNAQLDECMAALLTGKSVSLFGPGGVGKSALAAVVASDKRIEMAFWFTIRPSLNDRLESLLFSCGYFLHQHGAINLWNMLLLGNGKIDDLNLAMGLIREDLALLAEAAADNQQKPIIFCFDELELLQVTDPDRIDEEHLQIQRFIESLQGYVPLLLVGHRPFLETNSYVELTGLAAPQIGQLFHSAEIRLSGDEVQKLYYHTNGNPRLLLLYRLLYQKGDSLAELLTFAPETPALQPILNRLWTRLDPDERRILQQLSVYQNPAPLDQWHDASSLIGLLIQYRLLQRDGRGGIAVVPALRTVIYHALSAELRERLHLDAATVLAARAEYTQTAYHFWQGGDETRAVELWYVHRQHEIAHGQATLAQTIFESISRRRLKPKQQKALDLIRAELFQLRGEAKQGLTALEASDWSVDSESSLRAQWLHGIFLDELGYPDRAIETFHQGQATVHRLLNKLANFHYRAGIAHSRQHNKQSAWKEAYAAQYNVLCLLGNLREQEGLYEDATEFYEKALALTSELDRGASSTVHRFLASVYGHQQRFQESIHHAHLAIDIYSEVGDRLNTEIVRSYLAATYLDMRHFSDAVAAATAALRFFRQIENSHFVATTAATLAEAYYELGDFANATEHAYEVLEQEEPYAYPYAHYTLGLVRMSEENLPFAQQHLSESAHFAQQNEDPFIEAYAKRRLGCVYRQRHMFIEAEDSMQDALRLFHQLGIQNEVAKTESELARVRELETN